MSALRLAIRAKRAGARFAYLGDRIVARDLDRLDAPLRAAVEARIGDVIACVSEMSVPDWHPSDVVDRARAIVKEGRRLHA